MVKMNRPDWNEYFFEIANIVKKRSTCLRRQVGAVAVLDNQIIATGYNGAPKGVMHCEDRGGCYREQQNIPSGERAEVCWGTHGEQNLIAQAAYTGTSLQNATVYCTTYPCSICMKMMVNAGIKEVYYMEWYNDPLTKQIGIESGIPLIKHKE